MINVVTLLGRLERIDNLIETSENSKYATMVLKVPRNFKNSNGEYENDYIKCKLYNSMAENIIKYVKEGGIIKVKGRVEEINNELVICAEKVTFLSSSKNQNDYER